MGGRRKTRLGAGADRLERRKPGWLLLAVPAAVVALALIVLGAFLAEYVADPSGLAMHVPQWIAKAAAWLRVDMVVWIATLIVVGAVLLAVQRRYGTAAALFALAVLVGVPLLALWVGELATSTGWAGDP